MLNHLSNQENSQDVIGRLKNSTRPPLKPVMMQLRVSITLKSQIDTLIQRFNQDPAIELRQTRSIQRSEILREALLLGMAELEERLNAQH